MLETSFVQGVFTDIFSILLNIYLVNCMIHLRTNIWRKLSTTDILVINITFESNYLNPNTIRKFELAKNLTFLIPKPA